MVSQRLQKKYIAVLAVVSALILIVGVKLKPKKVKVSEAPASQAEMLRLKLSTQERNLEELTSYFAGIADQVKHGLVWVGGLQTSGIVWGENGLIVTAAPPQAVSQAASIGDFPLEPDVVSPYFPVAALRVKGDAGLRPVFRTVPATLPEGSWVLQIAAKRGGGYLYAPGTYGGVIRGRCSESPARILETSLPLTDAALGSGVFDLYGNLLGVVVRCGTNNKAITPESVDDILVAARSYEGQLLRRYGFHARPLDRRARTYFKTDRGLLVTETWRGRPAAAAGLVPGDVIQALDNGEVRSLDDLARLVLPVAYPAFDLWVRRRGRTIRITMPATATETLPSPGAGGSGIQLIARRPGFLIQQVAPGSRAARAGLKPGDRLLRLGGRPVRSLAQAQRILSGKKPRPVFVVVARGDRQLGVFLE